MKTNTKKLLLLACIAIAAAFVLFVTGRRPPAKAAVSDRTPPPAAVPVATAATPPAVAAAALPSVSTNQTPTSRGTLPFVLTSRSPFTKPLRLAAEALGARTVDFLSRRSLLVEADPATRSRLLSDSRFESVSEYLPASKVQPALSARVAAGAASVEVSIVSLSKADRDLVVACLRTGGGELLAGCINEGDTIRAKLPAALVAELASRGDVKWMEEFRRPHLMNDVAVEPHAMNVREVWDAHGLTGAGQKITTSDSGIDTGDKTTMHVDLRNRVKGMYYVPDCEHCDSNGHGTHTAGSIVGDGTASDGRYRGTAHGADLYAWFCGDGSNSIYTPDSLADMFRPDNVAAYVHSASWGSDDFGDYSTDCVDHDTYVWENPDFLPVFSAGNAGSDTYTIGSPASAKNVLAVGATYRLSGNASTVTDFSSRGPCQDGRIKPDVASPGKSVTSTQSSLDGEGVSNGYTSMSGTSMACPLTAGAVALVRQWLVERMGFADKDGKRPTSALMKAVITGGAKDTTEPDNAMGWGRVDLAETLFPSNRAVKLFDRLPFAQGFVTNIVVVTTNAAPLDVQLVWVDYPGSASADQSVPRLVNDLDLTVTTFDGETVLYGNGGPEPDELNNVESVRIADAPATKYVVSVKCKTVLHDHTEGGAAALYLRGAFNPNVVSPADWVKKQTINGVTWSYVVRDGEATVGDLVVRAVPTTTKGSITVPSKLGGYPVTAIGDTAFYGCGNLTSVTIPASVTSIGESAFRCCDSLTTIAVNSSNKFYAASDGLLCDKDKTLLLFCPAAKTSATIPSTVTDIAPRAFAECTRLSDVTITACVTELRETFPASFASIANVVISEGTSEVGWWLFEGCSGLATVTIPASVTEIDTEAFASCESLTAIKVNSANEAYASSDGALYDKDVTTLLFCPAGKTSVTIPASVTEVDVGALFYCGQLTKITVSSANEYYTSQDGVLYDKDVMTMLFCPFGKTSVTIPASVTDIDTWSLLYCPLLTAINVNGANECYASQDGVLYDKDMTRLLFCPRGKTSVKIPDGVMGIGDSAFSECSALTTVTIPSSVTSIGSWAFTECIGLTAVSLPSSLRSIGHSAFADCSALTTVTIPEGVANIGSSAFSGCSALTTVTIPSSVTSIGDNAFGDCSGLTTVTIPKGVANIGSSAFSGCSALTTVAIPEGVTNIDDKAFMRCSNLTAVTIPSSVTSIGEWTFYECEALKTATIPPGVANIGDSIFYGCKALSAVTIPSGVTNIDNYAFHYCTGLTTVQIPSRVANVGNCAFYGCRALSNVVFCGNAPSTGKLSFYAVRTGCTATVFEGTTGWGDATTWNGLKLAYRAAIPDIGENPTKDQVVAVLSRAADPKLAANVTTGADYASFRAWAGRVKDGQGAAAGGVAVMNAPQAWLSYALDSATLIGAAPQEGDVAIEAFEPVTGGAYAFTVGVRDVEVGSSAAEENLKRVFGLEGGPTPKDLTPGGVDLSFAPPESGKVKFTAKPQDSTAKSFFMRVRMIR